MDDDKVKKIIAQNSSNPELISFKIAQVKTPEEMKDLYPIPEDQYVKLPNAYECLTNALEQKNEMNLSRNTKLELVHNVMKCLSRMSCSKVGIEVDPDVRSWEYIPGDIDYLEAYGVMGIVRCLQTSQHLPNYPFLKDDTPLVKSPQELKSVLKQRPLSKYVEKKGKSVSTIDHFYDKILHLKCRSGTQVLVEAFQEQRKMIEMFVYMVSFVGPLFRMDPETRSIPLTQNSLNTLFGLEWFSKLKHFHYSNSESKIDSPPKNTSVVKLKNNQLYRLAQGVNIESDHPQSHLAPDTKWVNWVVALDDIYLGKSFHDIQRTKDEMKYPYLETVIDELNESSYLSFSMATILYYLSTSDSMTIHVHQMQRDSMVFIFWLRDKIDRACQMYGWNNKKLEYRTDHLNYQKGSLLIPPDLKDSSDWNACKPIKNESKSQVYCSISQCGLIHPFHKPGDVCVFYRLEQKQRFLY